MLPNRGETPEPWYRVSTVWLMLGILLMAVVMGMITLFLAIKSYDGLVEDDYYKKGKEINRVLARDEYAAKHEIQANMEFDLSTNTIEVALQSLAAQAKPADLEVKFLHPTRSGEDHVLRAGLQSTGVYSTAIPVLAEGRWIVQIGTPAWRLSGDIRLPTQTRLQLRAVDTEKP